MYHSVNTCIMCIRLGSSVLGKLFICLWEGRGMEGGKLPMGIYLTGSLK